MDASQQPQTIGILAGESSGDNLGAGLMLELKKLHPQLHFVGVGGPRMQAAGLESLAQYESLAVNGFLEPLKALPQLISLQHRLIKHFVARGVVGFIGVDFNVFNFLLERRLKARRVPTVHYVSPSVYAWRRGRVKRIAKSVDLLLTLYPFEPEFYKDSAVHAVYVGHPLADEIAPPGEHTQAARTRACADLGLDLAAKTVALLPGTRRSELDQMLELFLQAAGELQTTWPDAQFVLPCPRAELRERVEAKVRDSGLPVKVVADHARLALTACHGALVKSGTSTLEAMLLGRPMVVSYRLGNWTYQLVKRLLRSPFIALPNILASRALVPELLQDAATPQALAQALLDAVATASNDPAYLSTFGRLHQQLRCDADAQAARAVADFLILEAGLQGGGSG